jgi:predicted acylesterase/phospholipase RssA
MKSKNFKILILPSGAATGIVTSTILSHLERDTGIPVYKHFDEIWCSSIGSVIAALLTTPNTATEPQKSASEFSHRSPPMSADEVSRFLEHSFSNLAQAISIRRRVKKYLPASILMRDTLIPLRILTAEVTQSSWVWPLETRLKTFSSEGNGATSLGSVVASSASSSR